MDVQPKTEPGSPPIPASSGHRNLKEMSISELVSVLRADFDRVEEVLAARDAKHKGEIGPLQEKIEVERLMRLQVEEELKKKEQRYQKLKRKWVDDRNAVAELKIRVAELENQQLELEAEKRSWINDKNALKALRIRCSELENANKKNLETIKKLRVENCKLAHEKSKADAKPLNAKLKKMVVRDSAPSKRKKDTGHSLGASDHVRGEASDPGPFEEGSPRPWLVYTRRKQGRVELGIKLSNRRSCLMNHPNLESKGILLD